MRQRSASMGYRRMGVRAMVGSLALAVRPGILLLVAATLAIGGCASSRPAPVIERAAVKKSTVRHKAAASDWRPNVYTVQKGDTVYGIAFDHGLDYKELAEWNGIEPPYIIRVGQQVRLTQPDQGVVTTALKPQPAIQVQAARNNSPLLKTDPKATREPYSEQVAEPPAGGARPIKAEAAQAEPSAGQQEPPKSAQTEHRDDTVAGSGDEEGLAWAWPTPGKVIGVFKEGSSAKGLDIAGKGGQPVYAAAPGKVVYSGSGLRGYGKLVIIKHNKTYLSAYAHNSRILVKEGQSVERGQEIAEMGDSDAEQVKLHFEIRRLGKPVDPIKYLPAAPAS